MRMPCVLKKAVRQPYRNEKKRNFSLPNSLSLTHSSEQNSTLSHLFLDSTQADPIPPIPGKGFSFYPCFRYHEWS